MHREFHRHTVFRRLLPRLHGEPNPLAPVQFLDIAGVQRRAAGAGVKFGLEPQDTEARQAHPLAPSDDGA